MDSGNVWPNSPLERRTFFVFYLFFLLIGSSASDCMSDVKHSKDFFR